MAVPAFTLTNRFKRPVRVAIRRAGSAPGRVRINRGETKTGVKVALPNTHHLLVWARSKRLQATQTAGRNNVYAAFAKTLPVVTPPPQPPSGP